jgi:hypothetical protein
MEVRNAATVAERKQRRLHRQGRTHDPGGGAGYDHGPGLGQSVRDVEYLRAGGKEGETCGEEKGMNGEQRKLINLIRMYWNEYNSARVLSILKAGQWTHTPLIDGHRPPNHIDGTRAETRTLKSVMGFPEFLEMKWKTK